MSLLQTAEFPELFLFDVGEGARYAVWLGEQIVYFGKVRCRDCRLTMNQYLFNLAKSSRASRTANVLS